jgi:hypothetical protein
MSMALLALRMPTARVLVSRQFVERIQEIDLQVRHIGFWMPKRWQTHAYLGGCPCEAKRGLLVFAHGIGGRTQTHNNPAVHLGQ